MQSSHLIFFLIAHIALMPCSYSITMGPEGETSSVPQLTQKKSLTKKIIGYGLATLTGIAAIFASYKTYQYYTKPPQNRPQEQLPENKVAVVQPTQQSTVATEPLKIPATKSAMGKKEASLKENIKRFSVESHKLSLEELQQKINESPLRGFKLKGDINTRDSEGYTALMRAARIDITLTKLLVENGADVDLINKERNTTALLEAIGAKNSYTVQYLIDSAGANCDAKETNPFMKAVSMGNFTIIKTVASCSSDVTVLKMNHDNDTAITIARALPSSTTMKPAIVDFVKKRMEKALRTFEENPDLAALFKENIIAAKAQLKTK